MVNLAITLNGLESIASDEIKEVLKAKIIKKDKGRIIFETKKNSFKDLRSIDRVLDLLKEFNFDHIEEFEENLKGIDFNLVKSTFRVDCNRIGDHDFNSQDISRSIGEILFEGYNKKIDFKNPETIIYVDILDNNCFIGIDLTGKLCKRGYRFKVHSSSINACLAYSLVRLSGLKDNEVLLDSFCGDGVVCIEAGFYKKARIIGVDNREGYLKSCRINSKIAKKEIEFLNTGLLESKIKGKEIDKVVSNVPSHTKRRAEGLVNSIYSALFDRLNKILKENGKCVFLTYSKDLLKNIADEKGYRLIDEIEVKFKDRSQYILILEKI